MIEEDLEPRAEQPQPKKLGAMSIEELREYIADLEAEIARAKESIAAKEHTRAAAETFFRK